MGLSSVEIGGWRVPAALVGLVVYLAILAVGWSLKRAIFSWLEQLTRKTETEIDDVIIDSINLPLNLMIMVWGITLTSAWVTPNPSPSWVGQVAKVATIISVLAGILFIDFLLINILKMYEKRIDVVRQANSFLSGVVHVVVWCLGALVALDSIGVSITPILASLGIGSLAVALALQPTFENIFAGFQIFLDKPVMPGQFVRLESGEEGFIEKIGWRTSWLRQATNNTVILPNKQLVNGRILNFNYPDRELTVPVEIGVHYNSNLEQVEKVAIEVATEVMRKANGGVPAWNPLVRFHTFGDFSVNATVILRASAFNLVGDVRHAFVKALAERFAKEGIVIPYPVRALNTSQETASFAPLKSN